MAREISLSMPYEPCHIRVLNLVEKMVHLSRGIIAANGSRAVAFLNLFNKEWARDEAVNSVPLYKSKTDKSERAHQKIRVQGGDDKRLGKTWTDEIQFKDIFSEWKSAFLPMTKELATILCELPTRVVAARHRIDLAKLGNAPTHQNRYRFGP